MQFAVVRAPSGSVIPSEAEGSHSAFVIPSAAEGSHSASVIPSAAEGSAVRWHRLPCDDRYTSEGHQVYNVETDGNFNTAIQTPQ